MGKWLDKKPRLILKFMTSSTGNNNNYNAHITQYLKKLRQSDN